MTFLKRKKLAFMSIVNQIKGFVRSVSGIPPLTLPDCVDEDSLIDYSISGNSVQNGTPTPEAPVRVESVGIKTKNLAKVIDGIYRNVAVVSNGEIIVLQQWTMDEYLYISMEADNLVIGKTYTLSFGGGIISTKGTSNVEITFEDGTVKQLWGNWKKLSFTVGSTVKKIQFVLSNTDTGLYKDTPIKIQLEEGAIASEYEPFGYKIPVLCSDGNSRLVTTNIYLDEPLRKVGDYGDYIDFEKSVIHRAINVLTFTKETDIRNYGYGTSLDNTYHFQGALPNSSDVIAKTGMFSNILPAGDYAMNSNAADSFFTSRYNSSRYPWYAQIEKALIDDLEGSSIVDKFKTLLTSKNAELYTCLETPTETPIILPKLPTFEGTTIYTIDTGIQPSDMSATYYATSKE